MNTVNIFNITTNVIEAINMYKVNQRKHITSQK